VDRMRRRDLHYAALEGDLAGTRRLIAAGADVNAPDSNGFTPLHFAAQEYALSVADALLHAGAVVDAQDVHGNTPLFTAVYESRGRGELITLLLSSGADPDVTNKHGQSPRGLAHLIGNFDVEQWLPAPDSGHSA
jgi:ankyrin repeat protein